MQELEVLDRRRITQKFTFYTSIAMFKKPSRTKNIRRKIEVTEDDPVDGEQGMSIDSYSTLL